MELFFLLVGLAQSIAVSLGVGSSTFAVTNYIVALQDNNVDPSERQLMHMVYVVLRIAMFAILITMVIQAVPALFEYGADYFFPFSVTAWLVTGMLFLNAVLMTKRIMPMSIGPALQAATWYMLAVLLYFSQVGLGGLSFTFYIGMYVVMFVLALVVINGALAYFKRPM